MHFIDSLEKIRTVLFHTCDAFVELGLGFLTIVFNRGRQLRELRVETLLDLLRARSRAFVNRCDLTRVVHSTTFHGGDLLLLLIEALRRCFINLAQRLCGSLDRLRVCLGSFRFGTVRQSSVQNLHVKLAIGFFALDCRLDAFFHRSLNFSEASCKRSIGFSERALDASAAFGHSSHHHRIRCCCSGRNRGQRGFEV